MVGFESSGGGSSTRDGSSLDEELSLLHDDK